MSGAAKILPALVQIETPQLKTTENDKKTWIMSKRRPQNDNL